MVSATVAVDIVGVGGTLSIDDLRGADDGLLTGLWSIVGVVALGADPNMLATGAWGLE